MLNACMHWHLFINLYMCTAILLIRISLVSVLNEKICFACLSLLFAYCKYTKMFYPQRMIHEMIVKEK